MANSATHFRWAPSAIAFSLVSRGPEAVSVSRITVSGGLVVWFHHSLFSTGLVRALAAAYRRVRGRPRELSQTRKTALLLYFRRCDPPVLRFFSSDGDAANVSAGQEALAVFAPETLRNTGYWDPGLPRLTGVRGWFGFGGHFRIVGTTRPGQRVCERAWLVRSRNSPGVDRGPTTYKSATVYPSGMIFDEKFVIDSDRSQKSETYRRGLFMESETVGLVRRLHTRPVHLEEAFYIGTNLDFLFFESLVYTMPKILYLRSQMRGKIFQVVANHNTHPAAVTLWDSLLPDLGFSKVLRPSWDHPIEAKRLTISRAHRNWAAEIQTGLRLDPGFHQLVPATESTGSTLKKIVLMRGKDARDFAGRVPKRFEDIVQFCVGQGFAVVDPATLTIFEQISLFRGADFIISPHGGALANLLWVRPGTKVLEVFDDWQDGCFKELAAAVGATYCPFFASTPLLESGESEVLTRFRAVWWAFFSPSSNIANPTWYDPPQ